MGRAAHPDAVEIVLGIDNIVFLSILVDRLPLARRKSARLMASRWRWSRRLLLLATLKWIMGLKATLFTLPSRRCCGK